MHRSLITRKQTFEKNIILLQLYLKTKENSIYLIIIMKSTTIMSVVAVVATFILLVIPMTFVLCSFPGFILLSSPCPIRSSSSDPTTGYLAELFSSSSSSSSSSWLLSPSSSSSWMTKKNDLKKDDDKCCCTNCCVEPLQVFLLAGQSNMVGMGSMKDLKRLLNITTNNTKDEYMHFYNTTSHNWAERDDVYIKFGDRIGKLTVGYGGGHNDHFGPELEFGWVLGDALKKISSSSSSPPSNPSSNNSCNNTCCPKKSKKIFLLKTAYGGRDLAIDFRPPSSGIGNYSNINDTSHYGWQYRIMINDIKKTLKHDLPFLIPNYNKDYNNQYKIKGIIWLQGWNDLIDIHKVNEYEYNLKNFIRDIRNDLKNLSSSSSTTDTIVPFLIGELGMHGTHINGTIPNRHHEVYRIQTMRYAERHIPTLKEFKNNTKFISTSIYAHENDTGIYGGIYHYYGRADTYTHIGHAFGNAMLEFL